MELMGQFTAIGMRVKVEDENALVVNTCAGNGLNEIGDEKRWTWSNPTNTRFRAIHPEDPDCMAASVECLWQGTKIFEKDGVPPNNALWGYWKLGKGKKPLGAWAGKDKPLITTPGEARRRIYIPAYRRQIERMMEIEAVRETVLTASQSCESVFLRDFDIGRGVDQPRPMSHAWVLAVWLNTGAWPE